MFKNCFKARYKQIGSMVNFENLKDNDKIGFKVEIKPCTQCMTFTIGGFKNIK